MILGLADGVDAGAALVVDDTLAAAVPQERLDRVPRSRAFPWEAATEALSRCGRTPRDVDVVAVAGRYTPPFAARRRPALLGLAKDPFSPALTAGTLWQEVLRGTGFGAVEADRTAEWLEARLREHGYAPRRVVLLDVHKCLAAAAYRCQPDDTALVLVAHPRGDGVVASVHVGGSGQLDRVAQQAAPSALHAFVDRCLAAMGLDHDLDGPRLEGLAARGEPDPALRSALGEVLSVRDGELASRSVPRPERRADRPWRLLAEAPLEVAAASVCAHLREVLLAWVAWHRAARDASRIALAGAWFDDGRLVAAVADLPGVESVAAGPWTGAAALPVGAALSVGGLPPERRPAPGVTPDAAACRAALEDEEVEDADPARIAAHLVPGGIAARFAGPDGPSRWGDATRSVLVRADDPVGVARARTALGRPEDEEPVLVTLDAAYDRLSGPLAYGLAAIRPASGLVRAPDGRARVALATEPGLVAVLEALRTRGCASLAVFPLAKGAEPPVATPADAVALWRETRLGALVLGPSLAVRP